MEGIREQQLEALQTGKEYIEKLVPAIKEIILELRGEQKPDTGAYLEQILEGVNFVIDIINGTMEFINEKEEIINREPIEERVQKLNESLSEKNDAAIAAALECGIVPFLEIFSKVSEVLIEGEAV